MSNEKDEDWGELAVGCLKVLGVFIVICIVFEVIMKPVGRVVWAIAEIIETLMYYALIIGVPALLIWTVLVSIWRKMNE